MLSWIVSNMEWIFSGIGVLILGAFCRYLYGRYASKSVTSGAPTPNFIAIPKKSAEPQPYDVLPREFEVWLGQEIPHIDIWVYVVNYLSKEIAFDLFQVTHFYVSGGPALEKIAPNGDVRIPPRSSLSVLCRRNLIDSEARVLDRVERSRAVNATFSLLCRASRGRKVLNREYSSLSINGWVRGVPSS